MRGRRFSPDVIRVARQLDVATKCPTCGKSTLVMSRAVAGIRRGGNQPVAVSPETHCACPGGPAAPVKGKTDADFLHYGDPLKGSRVSKGSRPIG